MRKPKSIATGVRVRRELKAFLDEFSKRRPERWRVNAKCEARQTALIRGSKWQVWLTVFFVEYDYDPAECMTAAFTVTALDVPPRVQAVLERTGWYSKVVRLLADHGYDGDWNSILKPQAGSFWKKGLRSTNDVLKEMTELERTVKALAELTG